ncbi:DUF445 family protein [Staphylococcus gallinarum]|uniref:DUF445 domain-containing protein n=1 Tax=Staphylococcus gallinarum TaxID=1293 RepID=UPI000E6936DF|nr:DUF445 family protein [Staphylococcus gallinarum]RIO96441.1 DUF445 family protein [Staphylococcus gallinarum]
MHAFLIIIFMMVIGALIGGITNVIAVRMLFHPFKTYYIFKKRVPFTPGLIPKRRGEIADKIGQVVEEHLLTESVFKSKLNAQSSKEAIEALLLQQIAKLKQDSTTIQYFANKLDVNVTDYTNDKLQQLVHTNLDKFYLEHKDQPVNMILPEEIEQAIDEKVALLPDLLFSRARVYLQSDKGATDIASMLDTFFQEKGKIVGLLQMFMTKESIAERIQQELIRLTQHPKAKSIATQVIDSEYQTMKTKHLSELVTATQFDSFKQSASDLAVSYLAIDDKAQQPLHQLMPNFISFLENKVAKKLTDVIIENASEHLSPIMKKINLRQLVEEQINTFDLDYIEKLIIDIANKELKLIMFLGFLLGGIIGLLQGVIAIFV